MGTSQDDLCLLGREEKRRPPPGLCEERLITHDRAELLGAVVPGKQASQWA
jgi:hypothetical protein